MSTHDLNDEASLVRGGGIEDVVDGIADPGQRRVAADGGVGARHVVIDRSHQTNNVQRFVWLDLSFGQIALGDQFLQQAGPFGTQDVGTRQAAISSTDDQSVDPTENHVLSRHETASPLAEAGTAGRADQGASSREPPSDILPVDLFDHITAVDQTLVTFVDGVGLTAAVDGHADDGAHSAIHTRRIAARSQHGDALFLGGFNGRLLGRSHRVDDGPADSN